MDEASKKFSLKINKGMKLYVNSSWKEYQKIYGGTKQSDKKFKGFLLEENRKQQVLIEKDLI